MAPLAIFKDCEMTINIETGGDEYIIPLIRLTNAIELTDWIYQILSKPWCTGYHLIHFLEAVELACQFKFDMPAQIIFKEEVIDWRV